MMQKEPQSTLPDLKVVIFKIWLEIEAIKIEQMQINSYFYDLEIKVD